VKKKIILPLLLCTLACTSCTLKGAHHEAKEYINTLEYHENFKVLQLSDLHLSSYHDVETDFKYLDMLVGKAKTDAGGKLDLIIITGDLFTFATESLINEALRRFNAWGVPWTVTFGNHDEQCYCSVEYISETISKGSFLQNPKDSLALFKYLDDDMTGLSNNVINLMENNKVVYQIFAIDSNTYSAKDSFGYDYVHEDQIKWYEESIEYANKTINQNPNWKKGDAAVKSSIFQHIPVPEFVDAVNKYKAKEIPGVGVADEKPSVPPHNSGFFKAITENKSTEAMFVGHDHVNDFNIVYNGVHFVYGVKSTDNLYHTSKKIGYRLTTLNKDKEMTSMLHFFGYDGTDNGNGGQA